MMFKCCNGVEVPFDDEFLSAREKEAWSTAPGGGLMKPEWMEVWERCFQPGDWVLDVGAHVGILSIHMAMMGAKVIALEGAPSNYKRLVKFIVPFKRLIWPYQFALSNEFDTRTEKFDDCNTFEEQEIVFRPWDMLSKFYQEWGRPTFIKMDIEGMESVALLRMTNLISFGPRPTWQIEYHPELRGFKPRPIGFDFREFTKQGYTKQGYDIWFSSDDSSTLKPVDGFSVYGNYFLFPKK